MERPLGSMLPRGLWGGRQHPGMRQAPAGCEEVAESWDEAGKRKWRQGLATKEQLGAIGGTGGLLAQVGRHDCEKSQRQKRGGRFLHLTEVPCFPSALSCHPASCSTKRGPGPLRHGCLQHQLVKLKQQGAWCEGEDGVSLRRLQPLLTLEKAQC